MANKNLKYQVSADVQGFVDGMNDAAYSTDKTEKALQDMIKESIPLQKMFKSTQKEASSLASAMMLLSDAEKKTGVGLQAAKDLDFLKQKAKEAQNALSDFREEIKNGSSNTLGLDAAKESLETMGGAVSSVLGTIASFTGKQEDFNRAIATMATVTSVANTVLKARNMLMPFSSTMLKIHNIQLAAAARAEEMKTAATKKGIIAQKLFNAVAKANPYVLLASAILAVGAALTSFIIYTNKAQKAQKAQQEETEKQKKSAEELKDAFTTTGKELLTTYGKLKAEWKSLSSEHEKTKWIKDCQDKFKELGLDVNNVKDAEATFVGNTDAVVKSLMRRARAAAYAAKAQQIYGQAVDLVEKRRGLEKQTLDENKLREDYNKGVDVRKRDGIGASVAGSSRTQQESFGEYKSRKESEFAAQNTLAIAKLDSQIKELTDEAEYYEKENVKIIGVTEKLSKTSGNATKQQITYYDTLSKKVSEYEKKLKDLGPNASADDIKKAQDDLAKATATKHEYGIKIGIEKPTKAEAQKIISDLTNKLEDAKIKLNAALLTDDQQIIDEAKKAVEAAQQTLDNKKAELKVVLDTDPAIKQLQDFNKKVEDIWKNLHMPKVDIASKFNFSALDETGKKAADALLNKYNETADAIAKYNDMKANAKEGTDTSQIDEYISKLQDEQKMTEALLEQKQAENDVNQAVMDQKKEQEEEQEKQNAAMESYGQISKGVAGIIGEVAGAEAAQIAQMAMDMPLLVANVVKTISMMFAKTQAEAAASAFALPFPANLAAWASLIGTISSIFASLPSFDSGGIIPGGTSLHDNRIAQVASGEMILNQRQQDNLFKAIDQDRLGSGLGKVQIEGVIRGKDLLLVQKNYNAYAIKSGQNIYIK